MKPETKAVREAAKLLEQGKSQSYVLGWTKAGGFPAHQAQEIVKTAQEKRQC